MTDNSKAQYRAGAKSRRPRIRQLFLTRDKLVPEQPTAASSQPNIGTDPECREASPNHPLNDSNRWPRQQASGGVGGEGTFPPTWTSIHREKDNITIAREDYTLMEKNEPFIVCYPIYRADGKRNRYPLHMVNKAYEMEDFHTEAIYWRPLGENPYPCGYTPEDD